MIIVKLFVFINCFIGSGF